MLRLPTNNRHHIRRKEIRHRRRIKVVTCLVHKGLQGKGGLILKMERRQHCVRARTTKQMTEIPTCIVLTARLKANRANDVAMQTEARTRRWIPQIQTADDAEDAE